MEGGVMQTSLVVIDESSGGLAGASSKVLGVS